MYQFTSCGFVLATCFLYLWHVCAPWLVSSIACMEEVELCMYVLMFSAKPTSTEVTTEIIILGRILKRITAHLFYNM